MATWTKIPETHIAATLGKAVSKTASAISLAANKSLDGVEEKIKVLEREASSVENEIQAIHSAGVTQESIAIAQKKASAFNQKSARELSKMLATINAVNASLIPILRVASTLKAVVSALKIPLPPLEILIKVIKLLPIPQMYLVVCFTVIESDLLEMMEQLIAQAKEEITGIEAILDFIEKIIKPVQIRAEEMKARIALLQVSCNLAAVSESDKKVLADAGLYDKNTGESIFDKIQAGLQGGGNGSGGGAAGYGIGDNLDLTSPEVANKVALAKEGDTISIKRNPSGSYIETWFCISDEPPTLPAGFPQISGSWTKNTEEVELQAKVGDGSGDGSGTGEGTGGENGSGNSNNLWKVDLKVTGNGNIFGGLDSEPQQATEDDLKYRDLDLGTDDYLILGYDNYDQEPGILKVDDWTKLLENVLEKVRDLPLSQDLKNTLTDAWNNIVVKAKDGDTEPEVKITKFQWVSKLGEIYNIEILEDEHSPKVAIRRFARVTDQGGSIILDGLKTFSTDPDSLIQEIKIQLDQLTQ